MIEPGLDRHEWESELASIEDDLHEDPVNGLPLFANLVERMLHERGVVADRVATEGADPEIVKQFEAAREVADRAEVGEVDDPGDVADAINGLRVLFDYLIVEHSA
jgi:hypothetical protein